MSDIQKKNYMGQNKWTLENPLMTTIKYARYKFISKMITKNDVVLDVGCGTGVSSLFYAQNSKKVIGIDLLSDLIEVTNKKNLTLIKGDIFKTSIALLKKKKISFISCNDFIEHFSEKNGLKLIKKFSDLLPKKGGTLIIGTPSIYSKKFRAKHNKKQHLHEYDPIELKTKCLKYFPRVFLFSMNDEVINTGFHKLSWFTFAICVK